MYAHTQIKIKMLSEVRYDCRGRIDVCGRALAHSWHTYDHVATKEISRRLNVSPKAVRDCLSRDTHVHGKRNVPVSSATRQILNRRKLVKRLVSMRSAPGHFKKLFPSCADISRQCKVSGEMHASPSTVRRDLKNMGFAARRRPKGPANHAGDDHKRLLFCRKHCSESRCLFSDEKMFDINDHGCLWDWCRHGVPAQRRETARFVPKVHVWGLIGVGIKKLVILPAGTINKDVYIRKCLSGVLVPLLAAQGNDHVFQQDGAAPHTARRTLAYLERKNVKLMEDWPPRSPQLNPIENLWALLQRSVSDHGPSDASSLTRFVQKCWDDIPQSTVDCLVRSFNGRCRNCIDNNGR